MRRRTFIAALGGAAAWPLVARAQQPAMPVIGRLINGPAMGSEWFLAPFRQGLGDAGFVEGRNLVIEYRWADGHNERLLALARDTPAACGAYPANVSPADTVARPIMAGSAAPRHRLASRRKHARHHLPPRDESLVAWHWPANRRGEPSRWQCDWCSSCRPLSARRLYSILRYCRCAGNQPLHLQVFAV